MRVYREYAVNLGTAVKFKETLPFVESFLADNSLHYDCLIYSIDINEEANHKLLRYYPSLQGYGRQKDFHMVEYTNNPFRLQDFPGGRVGPDDAAMIKSLASRIPRPINPFSIRIDLEGIEWFPQRWVDPTQANAANRGHITLEKSYGFGDKYNPLQITLEISDPGRPGGIMDDQLWKEKLEERFGKLKAGMYGFTRCVFEPEEQKQWETVSQAFQEENAYVWKTVDSFLCPRDSQTTGCLDPTAALAKLERIESMSLKKILVSLFKGTGYRFITGADQHYLIRKRNTNGHCFRFNLERGPSFKLIDTSLSVEGCNFHFSFGLPAYTPETEKEMETYIRCLRQIAQYVEYELAGKLLQTFGSTPDWYLY